MVEWFKALVLKTSEVQASVGSNPTLSAILRGFESHPLRHKLGNKKRCEIYPEEGVILTAFTVLYELYRIKPGCSLFQVFGLGIGFALFVADVKLLALDAYIRFRRYRHGDEGVAANDGIVADDGVAA